MQDPGRPALDLLPHARAPAAPEGPRPDRAGRGRRLRGVPRRIRGEEAEDRPREVGSRRLEAQDMPHHEGERPGERVLGTRPAGRPRARAAAFRGECAGEEVRRPPPAHPPGGRPHLRPRRRLVVLRLPPGRPVQPRDSRQLVRAAQGRAPGQGGVLERGLPARRSRDVPQRRRVGVLQRGDRRAALGLRHREVGLAPRQPPRQRSGRVDEQGAQARAGAGAPLRLGGASEDRAVRLGELVQ